MSTSSMTFIRNKARQNYRVVVPKENCSNCARMLPLNNQCSMGGFFVRPNGVCDMHQTQKAAP